MNSSSNTSITVDKKTTFIKCPCTSCGFGVTYEKTDEESLPCERCLTRICLRCTKKFHGSLSCDEFKKGLHEDVQKAPFNAKKEDICPSCRYPRVTPNGAIRDCPICGIKTCVKCSAPSWSGHACGVVDYAQRKDLMTSLNGLAPLIMTIVPKTEIKCYLENRLTMVLHALAVLLHNIVSMDGKPILHSVIQRFLVCHLINPDSLGQYVPQTFYTCGNELLASNAVLVCRIVILGTIKLLASCRKLDQSTDYAFSSVCWVADQWRFHSDSHNNSFSTLFLLCVRLIKKIGFPLTIGAVRNFLEREIYPITDTFDRLNIALVSRPKSNPLTKESNPPTKASDITVVSNITEVPVTDLPMINAMGQGLTARPLIYHKSTLPPLPIIPIIRPPDVAIKPREKTDAQTQTVEVRSFVPQLPTQNIIINDKDELRAAVEKSMIERTGQVAVVPIDLIHEYATTMVYMLSNVPKRKRTWNDAIGEPVKRTKS
jgi:hypothetical protein